MKRNILYLLILTLHFSCKQDNKQEHAEKKLNSLDSLAIVNNPKSNLNIQTNSFFEIDSSGVLMFPLAITETEKETGTVFYKDMPNNGYWNIIFYNSKTKEYHLLSERKMVILNYNYRKEEDDKITQTSNYIFYGVYPDDFNNDKKLTIQDPQYLFVSDKFGNNFRQLSPIGYNLNNWKFIKSLNKLILTARKDSDKNNKFDDNDEITTFEIELDKENSAKEIFSNDFKNKLKILFNKDWK